jgi:hypothetical protein
VCVTAYILEAKSTAVNMKIRKYWQNVILNPKQKLTTRIGDEGLQNSTLKQEKISCMCKTVGNIPIHFCPSAVSSSPGGHTHLYPPSRFLHWPPAHIPGTDLHSFTSTPIRQDTL